VPPAAPPPEAPKYFQKSASGVPIAVIAFGFSVMALSLANAEIINIRAEIFVPIAFGTGALGMGLWESRHGNLMEATFATANACFLFTTALMLRWFRAQDRRARLRQASNSLASEPRDAWTSSQCDSAKSGFDHADGDHSRTGPRMGQ
jgi:succinate-acetate transporter protein